MLCQLPLNSITDHRKQSHKVSSSLAPGSFHSLNITGDKEADILVWARPLHLVYVAADWSWLNLCLCVYLVRQKAVNRPKACRGISLTLFRLPCSILIVQQILPNLMTGCSRPICAVTCCSALCLHWMLHKGQQLSPVTATLKHTEIVCENNVMLVMLNTICLYTGHLLIQLVSCQLEWQKHSSFEWLHTVDNTTRKYTMIKNMLTHKQHVWPVTTAAL